MDKRTLLGIFLIALLTTIWMVYTSIYFAPRVPPADTAQVRREEAPGVPTRAAIGAVDTTQMPPERWIEVETDLLRLRLSSYGATVAQWELRTYRDWRKEPVRLIPWGNRVLAVSYYDQQGQRVDTRRFPFTFLLPTDSLYRVSGQDSLVVRARYMADSLRFLERWYVIYGNRYDIQAGIRLVNMQEVIAQRRYDLLWPGGLKYQEYNSVDESHSAKAMISLAGSIEELDAHDFAQPAETQATGQVDWAGLKTKYFAVALLPVPRPKELTVFARGQRFHAPNDGVVERYELSIRLPYRGGDESTVFQVYGGPLAYDIVKGYGLEAMVDFGLRWLVRPIGEFFMLPVFKALHWLIPNYGIAIILFAVLMKILMHPLILPQLRSAQRMQLLAPELQKIREKYRDDLQAQQRELFRLYQEYGINPMSGCLPMLLQLPILYALWAVLNYSIELRQTPFVLWITDLSVPDRLVQLPFRIPLFGFDYISGVALLMGAALLIQQRLSITDPRQRWMVYFFPILLTLLFSAFPAGLNLYYFTFNLLSIGHQLYLTRFTRKKLTLEDLKRQPKREGWLMRRLREAQALAEEQAERLPPSLARRLKVEPPKPPKRQKRRR
ncbi:MAG: membrane protein insertase YidC [Chlorobiota bacterium]